jgi:hypothetical protein
MKLGYLGVCMVIEKPFIDKMEIINAVKALI